MDGNEKEISILYRQLYGCMMAICVRYQQDEHNAKLVMNDSFLKIIYKLDTYDPNVPFLAWVRRIVVNSNIDAYRKEKRNSDNRRSIAENLHEGSRSFTLNEADLVFDADDILEMINSLPRTSREVFNLFAIDGYSHAEIGDMLDISEGTSKWHVSNARKRIQSIMDARLKNQNIAI